MAINDDERTNNSLRKDVGNWARNGDGRTNDSLGRDDRNWGIAEDIIDIYCLCWIIVNIVSSVLVWSLKSEKKMPLNQKVVARVSGFDFFLSSATD